MKRRFSDSAMEIRTEFITDGETGEISLAFYLQTKNQALAQKRADQLIRQMNKGIKILYVNSGRKKK